MSCKCDNLQVLRHDMQSQLMAMKRIWKLTDELCRSMMYLPGDVSLPTPPGLTEMLQNGASLVLLDTLRHHVQNVMHDSCSELQVKVGLNTLLGDL